ncbi:MAG: SagB/ThcOx family dehydrogenase [Candidatus Marinimicrobia bacterium]|nr:SagB/ThcOx family dehydrogenase [Candidatus Neomarinimicrobiota bacterium]MCF7829491.1 SagB/ThcOx family dehydrogenase [Candidatus Neomarinimicrobiota bacterium]MCF7880111.1 SagB/ThcOx family dehydrogenase [Candidatus Neomarinimicrobiota bacterium]
MKHSICSILLAMLFGGFLMAQSSESQNLVELPAPDTTGTVTLEQSLQHRESVRDYSKDALTLTQLSQLLWAAQGVTRPAEGKRTAPSAGAQYPLEIYVAVGNVKDIAAGVYQYIPDSHSLKLHLKADTREGLSGATMGQSWIAGVPVVISLSGVYERITDRYSSRGELYTHIEVGAVAENIYLQATAQNLGTVFMGAVDYATIREVLELEAEVQPFGLMPVGHPG